MRNRNDLAYNVYHACLSRTGVKPTVGPQIGLEVEVEGNKFPKTGATAAEYVPPEWKYTKDGSLRGNDNAEYVLRKPIKFNKTDKAIDNLWSMFEKYGSVLDDSNRTSVHVHLNVQDWHANRYAAFLTMYFLVEDLLTHWCGDTRVGNLFCLRAKDAPAIIRRARDVIRKNFNQSVSNGMHYSGLNLLPLWKYGTVEIRTMRGITDPDTLKTWVNLLKHMYDVSEEYKKDPREIVQGFSGSSSYSFLSKILGSYVDTVIDGSGMNQQQLAESLLEGVRNAQEIAYSVDWDNFKEQTPTRVPFRTTKSGSSLSSAYASLSSPPPVTNTTTNPLSETVLLDIETGEIDW